MAHTLFDRRGESTLRAVCFATRSLRIPVIMETIAGIRKGRFVSDGGVKGGDPACNPSRRAPTPNPNPTVAPRPQAACTATGPSYNQSIKVCSSSDTNEVRAPPPGTDTRRRRLDQPHPPPGQPRGGDQYTRCARTHCRLVSSRLARPTPARCRWWPPRTSTTASA